MSYIDNREAAQVTRAWAADTRGWYGARGGWIYRRNGSIVAQGWWPVWNSHRTEVLDYLTRKLTAFDSFAAMLDTDPRYRPTIRTTNVQTRVLADAYDVAMSRRNDSRRAFRGILAEIAAEKVS